MATLSILPMDGHFVPHLGSLPALRRKPPARPASPPCPAALSATERRCWQALARGAEALVCPHPGPDPQRPPQEKLPDISDALAAAIRALELAERDARWERYAHECSEWESLFQDILDELEDLGVT
eukprot:EG_transcript_7744